MTRPTAPTVPPSALTSSPLLRLGGWSAIGFAVIILLTNVLILVPAGMPTTGADPTEASHFFGSEADAVGLATVFLPAAWVLATMFGAVVAAASGAPGGRVETWSLVGLAGLVLQNATFTAISAIRLALAESGAEGVAGLWALHEATFGLNGTFLALALVGLSLGGVAKGLTPAWVSRLGLVAAAVLFVSASLTPLVMERGGSLGLVGLAGWLLWVVWLAVYGVCLIRHRPGDALGRQRGREPTSR